MSEKIFQRKKHVDAILALINKEKTVLITGARQIGKSTIMRQVQDVLISQGTKTFFINLEDLDRLTLIWLESKDSFLHFLEFEHGISQKEPAVVFLDEIQYLPDPARTLKALYDDPSIQFRIICTGSRFIGQKMLGSSMVGRGAIYPLSTFSFLEFLEAKGKGVEMFEGKMGDLASPSLDRFLAEYRIYGGYPKVIFSETEKEKRQALSAIIERIFTIDLPFFLSGQDLVPTRQVFQWIAENTGNMVNIEQMASLLHISSTRVLRSIDFLRESFLIRTVSPFFRDKSKEYSSRPKLYFHDIGLLSYVRNMYQEPLDGDGKITETLVAHDLISTLSEWDELLYYKKTSGSEIDFIVSKIGQDWVDIIEVKSGNRLVIPRIFYTFGEEHAIHRKIVTTATIQDTRDDIGFIPYWILR